MKQNTYIDKGLLMGFGVKFASNAARPNTSNKATAISAKCGLRFIHIVHMSASKEKFKVLKD